MTETEIITMEMTESDSSRIEASSTMAPTPKLSLGDRMKSYEHAETVPPYLPFIVRADGKSFSKYTCGLEQPFDDRFQRAMVRTANALLEFFNSRTVFVCSDEITLVFDRVATHEELKKFADTGEQAPVHIFNGRRFKIETLVAAKASVLFNRFMLEEVSTSGQVFVYSPQLIDRIRQCDAIFDARLIVFASAAQQSELQSYQSVTEPSSLASDQEIVNNLIWRSCYECHRNAVSTYGRFYLGKNETFKKNSGEMIDMMMKKGVDWEKDIPMHYRFGVYGKKKLVTLTNEKGEEYVRTQVSNFSISIKDMPMKEAVKMVLAKYITPT